MTARAMRTTWATAAIEPTASAPLAAVMPVRSASIAPGSSGGFSCAFCRDLHPVIHYTAEGAQVCGGCLTAKEKQ